MGKKPIEDSINALKDQLVIAKHDGDTKLVRILTVCISRLESKKKQDNKRKK
jgi:hypothetical protein